MKTSRLFINAFGELRYLRFDDRIYTIQGVKNGGFNIYLKGDQDYRKVNFIYG